MNIDEFFDYVLKFIPSAVIEEDNEGQLVIYTGLKADLHPTIGATPNNVGAEETMIVDLDSGQGFIGVT